MKKTLCLLLCLLVLLPGCGGKRKCSVTYLTLFDTVTVITGYASDEGAFADAAKAIHDQLLEYHRLFDIYQEYAGIHNLKTVNDAAGREPVEVDRRIIDLLLACKEYGILTGGRVNVAMGSVLSLWHEARSTGVLPREEDLRQAAEHVDLDAVVIDEAASTVYLADPAMRLDVGAIAKGWAVQRVCEAAPAGLLVSVGGNVCATGAKDDAGTPWVVGVQDPDGEAFLHTLSLTRGSVVTSGDYQRNFTVDGKTYHHIIDPDTLYPSAYWRSVTIVCEDSGLADALSTALFLLPREAGQALLDRCGAEAMWMDAAGALYYSPGFSESVVE